MLKSSIIHLGHQLSVSLAKADYEKGMWVGRHRVVGRDVSSRALWGSRPGTWDRFTCRPELYEAGCETEAAGTWGLHHTQESPVGNWQPLGKFQCPSEISNDIPRSRNALVPMERRMLDSLFVPLSSVFGMADFLNK